MKQNSFYKIFKNFRFLDFEIKGLHFKLRCKLESNEGFQDPKFVENLVERKIVQP